MGSYTDEDGNTVTYDISTGEIVSITPNGGVPPLLGGQPPAATGSGPVYDSNGNVISPNPVAAPAAAGGGSGGKLASPGADPGSNGGYPSLGEWRQTGATGAPPWAAAQLAGIPYAQWAASYKAAQEKATSGVQYGGTGISTVNAEIAAKTAADQRAQQQDQFNETMGYNKAVNDQTRAYQQQQLDVQKGNTLLNLGQRPDTLIKYLYAIRGQQTPQAISGTTSNLPGYGNITGQPNPAPGAGATGASPSSTPVASASPILEGPPRLGEPGAQNVQTNANLVLAAQNPGALSEAMGMKNVPYLGAQQANGQNLTFSPFVPNDQGGGRFANSIGNIIGVGPGNLPPDISLDKYGDIHSATAKYATTPEESARSQAQYDSNRFAKGGVIPEPVIGIGTRSGQVYTFGEEGPEEVEPAKKPYTSDGSGSYASGGTIGTPSLSADFFNNPNLKSVVDRGYNSSPQTPLFPQIGIATGGGQSLIPSTQTLNSLLPSEQSLYGGALQDEFGANPDDVFSLAKRLGPQVTGLRTPRFTN